jgi:hypothetical protein
MKGRQAERRTSSRPDIRQKDASCLQSYRMGNDRNNRYAVHRLG